MRICNDFLETFNKEFKGQKYSQSAHWKQGHTLLTLLTIQVLVQDIVMGLSFNDT